MWKYDVIYVMKNGKNHNVTIESEKTEVWFVARELEKPKQAGETIIIKGKKVDLKECNFIMVKSRRK